MNKFYKKILITGVTGTLGKKLTKQLLDSPFEPFEYTSKNNDDYLSIEEMRKLL